MEIIHNLDVRRTQVLIEAAIVEISLDNSLNWGVDFAGVDRSGDSVPLISTALSPSIAALIKALSGTHGRERQPDPRRADCRCKRADVSRTLRSLSLSTNGFSFAAVLQAIATEHERQPAVDAQHPDARQRRKRRSSSGRKYRSAPARSRRMRTAPTTRSPPFSARTSASRLTVTPHIHDGTAVRLDVKQEVSNLVLSSLAAVSTDTLSDVVTNKREIQTTVLAEDKETIVLGGLIEDDIQDTKKKVPLLGDIPLLGKLFQNVQKQHTKKSLLVFLRPYGTAQYRGSHRGHQPQIREGLGAQDQLRRPEDPVGTAAAS